MDTVQLNKEMMKDSPGTQVQSKELAALQARAERTSIYLENAEQQLIESQSLVSLVLSEAEDKLRWAASIDRALHTLHGVLAEREALIKKQEASIAELEAKVAGFDARLQEKESIAEQNAAKVARMQSSFSWKITAPFRLVRRSVMDKKGNG